MNPKYSITHTTYIFISYTTSWVRIDCGIILCTTKPDMLWQLCWLKNGLNEWRCMYLLLSMEIFQPAMLVYQSQGSFNYPFGGDQTLQMYGNSEEICPNKKCIVWVVYIMPAESVSFSACLMLWWYSLARFLGWLRAISTHPCPWQDVWSLRVTRWGWCWGTSRWKNLYLEP